MVLERLSSTSSGFNSIFGPLFDPLGVVLKDHQKMPKYHLPVRFEMLAFKFAITHISETLQNTTYLNAFVAIIYTEELTKL